MKLSLNINQQNALVDALSQLDSREVAADGGGKVVKVPYKLGSERRSLIKNLTALKMSLQSWADTARSIFTEHFPDVAEGESVQKKDRPEEFPKYQSAINAAAANKDEIDLLPFTEKVIYDDNEFPALAVVVLEEHGLIEGTDSKPIKLREVR